MTEQRGVALHVRRLQGAGHDGGGDQVGEGELNGGGVLHLAPVTGLVGNCRRLLQMTAVPILNVGPSAVRNNGFWGAPSPLTEAPIIPCRRRLTRTLIRQRSCPFVAMDTEQCQNGGFGEVLVKT